MPRRILPLMSSAFVQLKVKSSFLVVDIVTKFWKIFSDLK